MLAQGARVKAFEEAFARDIGRKHGIAVANGTAALHVAFLAHGLASGMEVVMPSLTFFATASTVVLCGAKPVFVDVDRNTYNMDPSKVAAAITRKTAAIMPVHLYGQTAEMDPILEAAKPRGIPVIEDAAQAAGAEYHGKKAGNLGDTACFSFYPTKNMTTGEGPRSDERPGRPRRPHRARGGELDGPCVLSVHRAERGLLPPVARGDRRDAGRGGHRLPAVVSYAAVPAESAEGPEDPRTHPGRGGRHPASLRTARAPRRQHRGHRAHHRGGGRARTQRLTPAGVCGVGSNKPQPSSGSWRPRLCDCVRILRSGSSWQRRS